MSQTVIANVPRFEDYARDVMELRYSHQVCGRKETWEDIAWRVARSVTWAAGDQGVELPWDIVDGIFEAIRDRKFVPGGRILSQAGRLYHQTDNCFCLVAEDSREGWARLAHKCTMMFMSGGGVGVCYDNIRPYGTHLKRSGGIASGPVPLIQMINGIGAAARQGGERRGAIYASLKWDHPDIYRFIHMKNSSSSLPHTNISVKFDAALKRQYKAQNVFYETLKSACQYGDPGFQFDTDQQILRNACTEIISDTDSDSCCLGSINFATVQNLQELADVTNLAVLFLLCNTLYTDTPTPLVKQVKQQNRRIGLGLMGVAEWFLQRGLPYGDCTPHSLDQWLRTWQQNCDNAAVHWSNKLSVNKPVATRAIAPTGTISIVGGHTTPGIEPIFHTAYERCYNTLQTQEHSDGFIRKRVVDSVVVKLLEQGYDVKDIDTAYTLSQTTEGIQQRIAFQAYCQQFVDNAISSTVNLPQYTDGIEDQIAPILLAYLPKLRGITFYPDGAYGNQPVTPIDITDVIKHNHVSITESDGCKGGSCGI